MVDCHLVDSLNRLALSIAVPHSGPDAPTTDFSSDRKNKAPDAPS